MAKTKIGFDIGAGSLKIAVDKRGEMVIHEVRLPENMMANGQIAMPNAFSAFLKRNLKELRIPRGTGALVIPPNQVICRQLTLPRMTESQLLMNLPYEFSDFIQGETEQYYCDYALCEELPEDDADNMTMMAAAVSRREINDYLQIFSQAGISLKLMIPQEMALIQLARNHSDLTGNTAGEYCFVDLGHTSTQITMVYKDRIQAVRQADMGGRALDRIIADQMDIDVFLADTYKRKNHGNILNHKLCREFYHQLAVEVLKVINFYHFTFRHSRLKGIYLLGGGAAIEPLCQTLQEMLEMPLLPVEDLIPGQANSRELCSSGALAVGVALSKEED